MFDNPLSYSGFINRRYKYVGPGSNMSKRNRPYNKLDRIAYDHDVAYGKYGKRAYYRYNHADRKFLHDLRTIKRSERDRAYYISKGYFNLKRLIAPNDLSQNIQNTEMVSSHSTNARRRRIARITRAFANGNYRPTNRYWTSSSGTSMSGGTVGRNGFARRSSVSSNNSAMSIASRRSSLLGGAAVKRVGNPFKGEAKKLKVKFKAKRKRYVKVPNKLKKQIKTVIDNDKVLTLYGYYQQTFCGDYYGTGADIFDKQTVDHLPIGTNGAGSGRDQGRNGVLFDCVQLMDAVSILYCKKTAARVPAATDVAYNVSGNAGGNFSLLTQGSNLKVEFTKLQAITYIKNNSHRTVTLYWYECKPKQARVDTLTAYGPIEDWETCLYQDYQNNVIGTNSTSTGPAYRLHNIRDLHTQPSITSGWSKMWSYNLTKIKLEPGQTYEKVTNGDAGVYDFSKYYQNVSGSGYATSQTFMPIQKFNRHIMIKYMFDQVFVDAATSDAFTRTGLNLTGHAIVYETVIKYKFKMPDQVGFRTEAALSGVTANTPMQLNARHRRYGFDTWTGSISGAAQSIVRVDPVEPTTDETTLG